MHAAVVERLYLEADLRRAIERREFVLEYQPIVDILTRRVVGTEALVRWRHPERGLLYPGAFIEVAEETGLINAIGLHVLQDAVTQAADWRRRFPEHESMLLSVNVSPQQLSDPRLVEWVTDVLTGTGCDPATLILEITESATVRREAGEQLNALKQLGVLLAVDDFGTGYSSLSYLQRLPIDVLKIDRSFVSGDAPDGSALAPAIVELARALRLRTIAEGVETAEQADRLVTWGCDMAQGFHLAKPMSAERFEGLVVTGLVPSS